MRGKGENHPPKRVISAFHPPPPCPTLMEQSLKKPYIESVVQRGGTTVNSPSPLHMCSTAATITGSELKALCICMRALSSEPVVVVEAVHVCEREAEYTNLIHSLPLTQAPIYQCLIDLVSMTFTTSSCCPLNCKLDFKMSIHAVSSRNCWSCSAQPSPYQ